MDEAIGLLYESAIDREFLVPALDALMDEFSGSNASFYIRDRNTNAVLFYEPNNVSTELRDRYVAEFELDPWNVAAAERFRGPVVARGTDLVTQSMYRRSQMYSEIISKAGIEFMIAAGSIGTGDFDGYIVVNRTRQCGNFSTREVTKLTALLPHILRVSRLTIEQRLAAQVFRGIQIPWVEVSTNGIERINESAAALLRRSQALKLRNNRLIISDVAADGRLARWISAITTGQYRQRPATSMQITIADGGRAIQLTVLPSTSVVHGVRTHRAVVLICEQDDRLCDYGLERFGFTSAEEHLVRALLSGERLAHYAQMNGRSIHTARSQLKSALRKSQASSQAELVRRIVFGQVRS